ncbi:MAG: hypothetical protein LEGION0403_FIIPPAGN_00681 [Legionella sp.]|uniref:oxygen-dependent tRNA uridine(34) hydroxylase TrhO n=1 Tax=Legionella sp. TaxID=459 RepID=UPI003D0E7D8E
MQEVIIASFYKFVPIDNYESMREPLLAQMNTHHVKGSIILAAEGINGSVAGPRENIDRFYQCMRQDVRLADLRFKETVDKENPFEKARVKLRTEIVSMGISNVDPLKTVGTYLSPEKWNELIQDPEVILIDTRNDYEYDLGTFKNAINPNTENFRNFPEYVEQHLLDKKDKKIAMFCTGGIRCEKSTAYLKDLGFPEVYHLQDGILHYIETMPKEKSLWDGQCFVFDNRVAVDADLARVYPQLPLEYRHKHKKNKEKYGL